MPTCIVDRGSPFDRAGTTAPIPKRRDGQTRGIPVAGGRRLCLQWRHFTQSDRNLSARGSLVKLHDSVDRILRQKGSEVYSISPDATVYEALETTHVVLLMSYP